MSEEEYKAIYRLKVHTDFAGLDNGTCIVNQKDIKRALKLIQKQDKQIEQYQNMLATNDMLHVIECEKKDKVINLMAEHLERHSTAFTELYGANADDWKEYFKKKAEEN